MVDTLTDLMSDAKNVIYIMSGYEPGEMDSIFRTATGVGLMAENGGFVRPHATTKTFSWRCALDMAKAREWKDNVKGILRYYHERLEGSEIEEHYCTLVFRYGGVDDQDVAMRLAGDCAEQINGSCRSMNIQAVPIAKALLIEQTDCNKATSASRIFDQVCAQAAEEGWAEPDFLTIAGDDREDEVVFRWGNDLGTKGVVRDVFTVSVGKRNTEARAALNQGSTGLLTVLQKLAKVSLDDSAATATS